MLTVMVTNLGKRGGALPTSGSLQEIYSWDRLISNWEVCFFPGELCGGGLSRHPRVLYTVYAYDVKPLRFSYNRKAKRTQANWRQWMVLPCCSKREISVSYLWGGAEVSLTGRYP